MSSSSSNVPPRQDWVAANLQPASSLREDEAIFFFGIYYPSGRIFYKRAKDKHQPPQPLWDEILKRRQNVYDADICLSAAAIQLRLEEPLNVRSPHNADATWASPPQWSLDAKSQRFKKGEGEEGGILLDGFVLSYVVWSFSPVEKFGVR